MISKQRRGSAFSSVQSSDLDPLSSKSLSRLRRPPNFRKVENVLRQRPNREDECKRERTSEGDRMRERAANSIFFLSLSRRITPQIRKAREDGFPQDRERGD